MEEFEKLNYYINKIESYEKIKNNDEILFYLEKIEKEVENHRDFYDIFEILSDEYDKTYNILSLYKQVSRIMTTTNSFRKFLKSLFKLLIFELNGESTSVMIHNNKEKTLEMLGYFNIKRGFNFVYNNKKKTTFKIGEGIAGKVAKNKKPIILDKANNSKEFIKKNNFNINSLICLPLKYNNNLVGILNLSHVDKAVYNEEHKNLLNLIASIISLKAVLYGYC
ncbi:MAG: GAF domain-containing protein [Candidatus Mcinerneyibacterium aminivorans]|uniref:GAF domain-containing protein n=1 Tax=Candidatus Mcinerneyibacterium aminivorans TaxID=2703815 RepID=A0A5D0MH28_9BACT|nr:MAG: GAF domain-containing protein [Candidatus Mcinerneyibacterium aminivorans]